MHFTYILKSLKDGKYYYGSTSDIDNRIVHHNSGKVKSTRNRRPLKLHYQEQFNIKKEAEARERFFKTIDGYIWLKENRII